MTDRQKLMAILIQILFVIALLASVGCRKTKELSQEERERSTEPAENQIIADEHGGIRFFITNGSAELKGAIPVFTTTQYSNYFIEADKIPQNSSTELWFAGSGTFDVEAEGFTAMPTTKRWKVKGLTPTTRIRVQKGIVLYTFTIY